jgi:hypothetical protein
MADFDHRKPKAYLQPLAIFQEMLIIKDRENNGVTIIIKPYYLSI